MGRNIGGRPRAADAEIKEHIVHVRLDAVEFLRLENLKMRSGKSASAVIRELLAGGSVRERMRRVHLDLMAQLKGIARNLNQLTRLANGIGYVAIAQKMPAIIAEINELLKHFRDDR